ncbi:cytochrome ubiquinol oxidase subunit I [Brevibacillus sp. AY1]|nr:cytochrome ubiquinol oxidase subunit I [Brevibacillus sp. AY1]
MKAWIGGLLYAIFSKAGTKAGSSVLCHIRDLADLIVHEVDERVNEKGKNVLDQVLLARLLTFTTLGFHIIFATLGVGIPLFISAAEGIGIWKKDAHYLLLARRWSRGYVITVAVGVVTGTCIALQLIFLWPGFMQLAGKVIGLPLFMETFAFFFEAIFLGIYLYTWDRFKNPWTHWILSIPIILGSVGSAFFITTVNAFMNTPQGFTLEDGVLTKIDPWLAMFNPATPSKVAHVLSSAFLTVSFVLGAIAAYHLFKKKEHEYYKKALGFTMFFALLFSLLNTAIGDLSGKFLAEYQPEKLAAGEWHFQTESRAKLIVGGIVNEDTLEVEYALGIPMLLSILANGNPNSVVIGLDQFPRELWPPLYVHYFFDGMVGLGAYLFVISLVFVVLSFFHKRGKLRRFSRWNRPLLFGIIAGGPLSILAIEFGWIFAESGRQPWILRGYLQTSHAATPAAHLMEMFILFNLLYVFLAVLVSIVLIRLFKKTTPEMELEDKKIIL